MIPSTASCLQHHGFGFWIAIRESSLPNAADFWFFCMCIRIDTAWWYFLWFSAQNRVINAKVSEMNFPSSQIIEHAAKTAYRINGLKDDWKVMIPASFGGWSPKLMSYKCHTHIILRRIWLCILSTYLFHPFIMEIPHSDSARTDKICFFKTQQSWSKVGILWGTFDIPAGRFCESENFCQVYPVGAESATALQKTPLVNSHWVPLNLLWSLSVLFNSPLVPTVDKFYIIL